MTRRILLVVVLSAGVGIPAALAAGGGHSYTWDLTPTGTSAPLRGVSAVSAQVAWASGSLGTVVRTVDGGSTA